MAETVVIEPSSGWEPIRFRLLWSFRELAYFLIWRDLKLRYKQTLLGASWAVIYPFVTTIVFTVIFGNWLAVGSGFDLLRNGTGDLELWDGATFHLRKSRSGHLRECQPDGRSLRP